jgi:hypothetical protein
MSVMSCPDCNGKVSDTATTCPHCGKPTKAAPAAPVQAPASPAKSGGGFLDPKRNLKALLGFVLVLGLSGWIIYTFVLNREGKKIVNVLASQSGVTRAVIPWQDRAESMLTVTLNRSKDNLASTIMNTCHPTGSKPSYGGHEIRRVGEAFSINIRCNWKGGVLGTDYVTVVNWEFKESGHVKAVVTQDNSAFTVAADNAKKLDEYFRTEVYAVLRSNMKD